MRDIDRTEKWEEDKSENKIEQKEKRNRKEIEQKQEERKIGKVTKIERGDIR